MFTHVVLGLLRDGQSRHGYQLCLDYRRRSDGAVSAGNFYRELARLRSDGFLRTVSEPTDGAKRRIPYQITDRGRQVFDRWLTAPGRDRDDLGDWLLFVDAVPPDARDRILEDYHQNVWMQCQELSRRCDDAGHRRGEARDDPYDPLRLSLARELKHAAAEIEFVEELRGRRAPAALSTPGSPPQPTRDAHGRGSSVVRSTAAVNRGGSGRSLEAASRRSALNT